MRTILGLMIALLVIGCEPSYKQKTISAEAEAEQERMDEEVEEGERAWQERQKRRKKG